MNPENDHAYKKIQCDSWEDAKAKAEAEGAYLVAINDEAEQKWLEAVYPEKAFFWIGLRVSEKGTSWQWDSGELLTYANWGAAGRPDSATNDEREVPIALIFASKKWMAIDTNSRLLSGLSTQFSKRNITNHSSSRKVSPTRYKEIFAVKYPRLKSGACRSY